MKLIFKILLISLFFSLIFMGLISCGARKSNVEKQKEETKTELKDNSVIEKQSESNIKTGTIVKTDDKNETVTEETILEPADKSKESFIIEKDGTKTVLNNVKKTVKKTIQKSNKSVSAKIAHTEEIKEAIKEQKAVERKELSKKEIKSKQTDKKDSTWYYIIIILICATVIYFILKRLKVF